MSAEAQDFSTDIAIIGVGMRIPGARDLAEMWEVVRTGAETIARLSDESLLARGVPPELLRHPNYVKAGGVLPDLDLFDAAYFGLTPSETRMLDPQHRLFLECVKTAFEDAGIDPRRSPGAIGVFAGAGRNAYLINNLLVNPEYRRGADPFQVWSANQNDFLPTRTSYLFGLTGPSVNVQTACSTSLACVHYACQSLLAGECSVAVAGAAAASSAHGDGYLFQEGGTLSPDGHCRPFDAGAKGTVMGSGAGVVVLKKLVAARRDGDRVHAVIKGSAVKNEGAGRSSFATPSVDGQVAVIAEALQVAGVDVGSIGYVESSGLGTALGDSIEIAALTQAFQGQTDAKAFCAVGSIKANVGHLDAASGIIGLFKCLLCLKHGEIPVMANFERPNPAIDFARTPFFVNAAGRPWPRGEQPRRAAVSSFALGGTNVHVVLEEAEAKRTEPEDGRRAWPLFVSARTPAALECLLDQFAAALGERGEEEFGAFCFTSLAGRKRERRHAYVVATDAAAARRALLETGPALQRGARPPSVEPVVWLFPATIEHPGALRTCYEAEPAFREAIDAAVATVRTLGGGDIRSYLWEAPASAGRKREVVTFVLEYALARLWADWGVEPSRVLGIGIGEWVAACVGGVMSLETALRLLQRREALLPNAAAATLTVELGDRSLRPLLNGSLRLIEIAGPAECVVAGPPEELAALRDRLTLTGVKTKGSGGRSAWLPADGGSAFEAFGEALRGSDFSALPATWLTSLTQGPADPPSLAEHWLRHLTTPVDLAACRRRLGELRGAIGIVVGADGDWPRGSGPGTWPRLVASLADGPATSSASRHVLMATAAALHAMGHDLQWERVFGPEAHRTSVPGHPLERRRHWVEPGQRTSAPNPEVGTRCLVSTWRRGAAMERRATPEPKPVWVVFGATAAYLEPFRVNTSVMTATVGRGGAFKHRKGGEYVVSPRSVEDLDQLFRHIGETFGRVARVWYLHPAEEGAGSGAGANAGGFGDVAAAVRAHAPEATLEIVTRGLQDVQGDELAAPADTGILLELAAAGERWPGLRWHVHDLWLPPYPSFKDVRLALDRAQAEADRPERPRITAIRGTHVWTAGYEPWHSPSGDPGSTVVVPGGRYLFNGELDDVAWRFLMHVAEGGAHSLLIAGSGLPPRQQWDDGLWPESRRRWGERIADLRRLAERGIEIDVRAEMLGPRRRPGWRKIAAPPRAFDGVFHAVTLGNDPGCGAAGLDRLSREWLSLTGGRPGWLLFGVVVPPRPGGDAEKALSHLFVESFGRVLAKREGFSVHTFAWERIDAPPVGGAVSAAGTAAVVMRMLAAGLSDAVIERPNAARAREDAAAADDLDRPADLDDYVPPETPEEIAIANIWARQVGVGRVGLNDRLFALGGNSIIALACARQIAERCGLAELPVARLATDTVRELAAYCASMRQTSPP